MTLKKNQYGIYKLRICIHKKLQPYFKKKEINKSLGTKLLKEAQLLSVTIVSKYNEILKVFKLLDSSEIYRIVNKFIVEELEQDIDDRAYNGQGTVFTSSDDNRQTVAYIKSEFIEDLQNKDYTKIFNIVNEKLLEAGLSVDVNSLEYSKLCYFMMKAQIELLNEAELRGTINKSNTSRVVSEKVLNTINPDVSKYVPMTSSKQENISLLAAIDKYMNYYNGRAITEEKKQSCDTTLKVKLVYLLADILDQEVNDIFNMDIEDIDSSILLDIQAKMYELPASNRRPFNTKEFRNDYSKTINFIEEGNDYLPLSSNTVKDYIDFIKTFFTFCHKDGITKQDKGHMLSAVRVETSRLSLNSDDVDMLKQVIFSKKEEEKNILIINYLYTSFRRAELFNSTIIEIENNLYFKIIGGKNKFANRMIPLHSELIEFYESLNCSTSKDINDLLNRCKNNISVKVIGKYFNETLCSKLEDSAFKTLHSTRKYFATKLTKEGVNEAILKYLMGHSYSDTTNKYYVDNDERFHSKFLEDSIELLTK